MTEELRARVVRLLRDVSRSAAIVRPNDGYDRFTVQNYVCIACGAHRSDEHYEDCELAAVLAALERGE